MAVSRLLHFHYKKNFVSLKKSSVIFLIFSGIVLGIHSCSKSKFPVLDQNNEMLSGGLQTVFDEGSGAYGHAFELLPEHLQKVHDVGDMAFEQTVVTAPAPLHGGLGPVFNNVSCVSCHVGDGRGKVPGTGESAASILFRVSQAGSNEHNGPLGIPGFGDQIQNRSTANAVKEADIHINYTEENFTFDDGTAYTLRTPTYVITNPYQPLPGNVMISARVAAPVFGLGLLEAVSDQEILFAVDEWDRDGDGISGKANYVWNVVENRTTLGRFGWKANQPSLLQQVAGAYNGDMGITTFVFPEESCRQQSQYDQLNDDVEISDSILHAVTFYIKTLSVPARRNVTDAKVQRGKQLFTEAGCASCHLPTLKTAVNVAFSAISNQTIHPFTDLLLHDMGVGLADNRPDYLASGTEWRTPPLWGIGLTQKVNGHTNFLHDGRARNLMEAVLWHGGEAEQSRNRVKMMRKTDREALIKFLESL